MRYSKQRELVMQTVQNLCDHPTAEEIYDSAAKECPGLSLGTVYRNLNSLVEAGRVRRVSIPGKADRFDHTLPWHSHLYCTVCGSVTDADVDEKQVMKLVKNQKGVYRTAPWCSSAYAKPAVPGKIPKTAQPTHKLCPEPLPGTVKKCILKRAFRKKAKYSFAAQEGNTSPGGEGWFDWNT